MISETVRPVTRKRVKVFQEAAVGKKISQGVKRHKTGMSRSISILPFFYRHLRRLNGLYRPLIPGRVENHHFADEGRISHRQFLLYTFHSLLLPTALSLLLPNRSSLQNSVDTRQISRLPLALAWDTKGRTLEEDGATLLSLARARVGLKFG